MIELTLPAQNEIARPLFAASAARHLSVAAVLAGASAGAIWVDDPVRPRVGLAETPEGHYLAGDPDARQSYPALKALLPAHAYLIPTPARWAGVLDQVWSNPFVRPHARSTFQWRASPLPDWRAQTPAAYAVALLDDALLQRTELAHLDLITARGGAWPSRADFVARGFGACVLHGGAIVSHCLADCVVGDAAEAGVWTDPAHRRRGLGSIATAAALEQARAKGVTRIGWHCLRNNCGSIAVATRVGFVHVADYQAYSLSLPAENGGDLSRAEWIDWAQHCARASAQVGWSAFFAAGAWAQAGDTARALYYVQQLVADGWQGEPAWLETSWLFDGLRDAPAFQASVAALRAQQRK